MFCSPVLGSRLYQKYNAMTHNTMTNRNLVHCTHSLSLCVWMCFCHHSAKCFVVVRSTAMIHYRLDRMWCVSSSIMALVSFRFLRQHFIVCARGGDPWMPLNRTDTTAATLCTKTYLLLSAYVRVCVRARGRNLDYHTISICGHLISAEEIFSKKEKTQSFE